jgi:hypothetical protein
MLGPRRLTLLRRSNGSIDDERRANAGHDGGVMLKDDAHESFFADDIVVKFVGAGHMAKGPAAAKQVIAALRHGKFDAELVIKDVMVGPGRASQEAALIGAELGRPPGRRRTASSPRCGSMDWRMV